MKKHFSELLELLKEKIVEMSNTVEKTIAKSIESLTNRDRQLAEEVINSDKIINDMEIEIDEMVMNLLALQQPVAVDLRMIIAISKINNDLERIGDHAVNIAQSAQRLADKPHVKPLIDIPKMAHICQSMLSDAIDSFFNKDSNKALMVCKLDNEIDELNRRVINELAFYMANDTQTIPRAMELLNVSKNLERVADIATNIAEEAIFVSEARTIKHHYNI